MEKMNLAFPICKQLSKTGYVLARQSPSSLLFWGDQTYTFWLMLTLQKFSLDPPKGLGKLYGISKEPFISM